MKGGNKNKKMRKSLIFTLALSLVLLASLVIATNYPIPYFSDNILDVAIVYGKGAASSDYISAIKIADNLKTYLPKKPPVSSAALVDKITEEEIPLGGSIITGDIKNVFTDNKLSNLFDGKLEWDDGASDKEKFNIHEEILLNDMNIVTNLDDEDLTDIAMTTKQKSISYRLVFEEDLDIGRIGHDDADPLMLSILGLEYEIEDMDSSSITISTSERKLVKTGNSIVVSGKTLVVEEIFNRYIQINGVLIEEDHTKKVDGIVVEVLSTAFYPDDSTKSRAVIKVGERISETYDDGDDFIGEDEADPVWVWSIKDAGLANGYIGVTYEQENVDAEDNLTYIAEKISLPNDFVEIIFEEITRVDYEDFEIYFDSSKDLYNSTSNNVVKDNVPVLVVEGVEEDSILVNGKETNQIYLYYANATSGTESNTANGAIEIFYEDVNKDVSDKVRPRYIDKVELDTPAGELSETQIFQIEVGDTLIDVNVVVSGGKVSLILTNDAEEIVLKIGGQNLTNTTGTFGYFGDKIEDSEYDELVVDNINVGTREHNLVSRYGIKIDNPDRDLEKDEIKLSIPDEQVFAVVSVVGRNPQEVVDNETAQELGVLLLTDDEVGSFSGKNLIVIGGSCINSVAAKILGASACGTEFTALTGVGAGKYLFQTVKSPYTDSKQATLIAGYEAADTTRGVTEFLTRQLETSIGYKVIG